MAETTVHAKSLLASLPPNKRADHAQDIADLIHRVDRKLIVLDDDPTGTQTVHDIPIVTKWTVEHLTRELTDSSPVSFVLTNSRSLDATATVALHREICTNLQAAKRQTGRDFVAISRSDSTLRGHFWEEMSILSASLVEPIDAWVVCPFFEEGGRLTINDIHYVTEGDHLVPAAKTPFAKDAAFGYRYSNLRRWVVEKSRGQIPAEKIESLSIDMLRNPDSRQVHQRIDGLCDEQVLIVNAADQSDLDTAVHALLQAELRGKRFLYRSAASLVAARSGIEPQPLLSARRLINNDGTGILIVIGSYVPKTTEQLDFLRKKSPATFVRLDVRKLLSSSERDVAVSATAAQVTKSLTAEETVVVYTSREIAHASHAESLDVGKSISQALVEVVRAVGCRPRLVITKGGITSSDIATEALNLERSIVMGQVLPGVPVWQCGDESRYPGMALVVFPGNVGTQDSLAELVASVT